jgi:hypothetical protein
VTGPTPRHAADDENPGTRFDPGIPHPARVYNVWLGGKDHYPADRKTAEDVIRCRPQVVAGALANRYFLVRAVRYLARDRGIRQFLDIGTGLPAPDNTHDIAQAITPEARIGRVAPVHCCTGAPSGPRMHVPAHAAQASRQGGSGHLLHHGVSR